MGTVIDNDDGAISVILLGTPAMKENPACDGNSNDDSINININDDDDDGTDRGDTSRNSNGR